MSMSDVSDMLYEFYRANVAKAPRSQQAAGHEKAGQVSPTSAETHEPSSIAAIAMNGASTTAAPGTISSDSADLMAASKNLRKDEMSPDREPRAFHPRIKYTDKSAGQGVHVGLVTINPSGNGGGGDSKPPLVMTSIPTSVVVPPSPSPQKDIKPIINPVTGEVITPAATASVIRPVPGASANSPGSDGGAAGVGVADVSGVVPQAAVIAAALLRDGYHSFQQQLRAQQILKQHRGRRSAVAGSGHQRDQLAAAITTATTPTKILENFLRQQREHRNSECENDPHGMTSDTNDGDDEEDDSRFNGFEDIHLMEGGNGSTGQGGGGKSAYGGSLPNIYQPGGPAEFLPDESQKYMLAHAQAYRNLEFAFGSEVGSQGGGQGQGSTAGGGSGPGSRNISPTIGPDGEPTYECRHCGKKYRWKSTLRRHENVECGGKEPSHQCPYCPYKSKQRGNLGVHVRKHHSNLPQLASKRRSKYSTKLDGAGGGGNMSDDSSSRLVIDCSTDGESRSLSRSGRD